MCAVCGQTERASLGAASRCRESMQDGDGDGDESLTESSFTPTTWAPPALAVAARAPLPSPCSPRHVCVRGHDSGARESPRSLPLLVLLTASLSQFQSYEHRLDAIACRLEDSFASYDALQLSQPDPVAVSASPSRRPAPHSIPSSFPDEPGRVVGQDEEDHRCPGHFEGGTATAGGGTSCRGATVRAGDERRRGSPSFHAGLFGGEEVTDGNNDMFSEGCQMSLSVLEAFPRKVIDDRDIRRDMSGSALPVQSASAVAVADASGNPVNAHTELLHQR